MRAQIETKVTKHIHTQEQANDDSRQTNTQHKSCPCAQLCFFYVYIGDTLVLCDTDWQLAVNICLGENVVAEKTDCQFNGDAMGLMSYSTLAREAMGERVAVESQDTANGTF